MSEEEREVLVRLLTMQADSGWASLDIEEAWIEEIERREREHAEGKTEWIPADEVIRQAMSVCANKESHGVSFRPFGPTRADFGLISVFFNYCQSSKICR